MNGASVLGKMERRVAITGMGCISSLGVGVNQTWSNLLAGKSGISRSATLTESAQVSGGHIKTALPLLPKNALKIGKFVNRPAHMALIAAAEAIEDAGLLACSDRSRIGTSIGTGMAHLPEILEHYQKFETGGARKISPFFIPRILPSTPGALIAILFELCGPIQAVSSACSTGAGSIGEAYLWIKHGMADAAVAGAAEAPLDALSIGGFNQTRAIVTEDIIDGEFEGDASTASRPFDHRRRGFVMGEGAAIVVVENLQKAKTRNAPIYAELVGYGNACDAFHVTAPAPDGNGAIRAMKSALYGLNDPLGYISAHATSTKVGDSVELAAIEQISNGQAVMVSAAKSAIGHLLGAAGAIEFVFAVKALQTKTAPPTLNFEHFERPVNPGIFISSQAQSLASSRLALCNSFGFGGSNVSLALRRFD